MSSKQQQLVNTFGLTQSANKAGFILADGTMLDFTNAYRAHRVYHAEALNVLYGTPDNDKEWKDHDLVVLLAELSMIRFCYTGVIHTANKPTPQQLRQLYKIVAYRSHPFEVLLSHSSGVSLGRDHIVSPTMHKLQEVFKVYEQSPLPLCADEFVIEKLGPQLNLIFRPLQKTIGSHSPGTSEFVLDPNYACAMPLFKNMTAEILRR